MQPNCGPDHDSMWSRSRKTFRTPQVCSRRPDSGSATIAGTSPKGGQLNGQCLTHSHSAKFTYNNVAGHHMRILWVYHAAMDSPGQGSELLNAQLLIDSIPGLIHTATPDGYLDYFNKPWLEYLGVTLDKVTGWNWTAFVHPEDVEGMVAKWRACLATGEIFECETRVRSANGQYRWMFHRKVPLRDANGNIVKWYGSSLDIEERKTAEEALRSSEAYLAEAQTLSHTGSWANAATGEPRYWSEECYRVLGFDPAEPLPSLETIFQRIHPEDRTAMRENLDRAIRDKADFEVDMRIVHPITGIRNIRSTGHAIVDTRGDLREMVGTVIDITEHKRAEEAIQRSEAYLAEAQRLSHTGSFGWKVSSGEIFWSDQTFRIFECDPSSKPTIEFILSRVHREDHDMTQQQIDQALRNGEGFDFEHRLQLPDGSIKHVRVTAHPSRSNAGDVEFVGAVTDITERKTTEDKVRRLVEAGIMGIFFATVEGGIVEANQAFLQLLQYDRQDLVSGRLRWADLTPAEWRERDERSMAEFLATGVFQAYEKEYFRKDGSRVPVLVGGARVQSANEGIVFVLDLSEQKRAEEKIRRSESYLAEAQRLSQTGSWAWSPDLTADFCASPIQDIRYWSEECYRVLSFDPQYGLPRFEEFFQRIHPDDQPGFREVIQTAIREKTEWEADYRIVHPSGAVRDIHVVGHPVLSTSGHLIEFVGTVIDVTERKKAEEERRRSEMELRQVLDFAPWHVAVLGADGKAMYLNKAGLDYHGLTREVWQDYDPHKLIHPDDHDRILTGAGGARLLTDQPFETEARLARKDGNYRWFLFRFNPLRDEEGRLTRWYVTGTDIEERKQAEDRLQRENVALREEIEKASMFDEIVGTSSALKSVLSRISKVAPSDSTVLITGETGTGKELVARAIHRRSGRASRPFVSVNCAAIPRDLIASELFGHEKGAFTGATQQRLGRFELANGGTIFLDEAGDLPAETQIALLRVLQEHEFERVGGNRRLCADVRVIAATNRNLQAAISAGTFRSDLFYRLNVFPIEIPSLRERRTDIPLLVEYFIDRYARKAGKNIKRVNKKTLELLQSYAWPGNIRELQNVIERSVILCETEIFSIDESWLPQQPLLAGEPKPQAELPRRLLVQEKNMIEAALKETRGRISGPTGAAVKLGIPRSTLESKLRSLKIDKNRFRSSSNVV
jgi:PAS domain S-box-containing protein